MILNHEAVFAIAPLAGRRLKLLTLDEQAAFDSLYNRENNVALMRAMYNGEDVAVIVRTQETDHGFIAKPIAILITDSMFEMITAPENPHEAMVVEDNTNAN